MRSKFLFYSLFVLCLVGFNYEAIKLGTYLMNAPFDGAVLGGFAVMVFTGYVDVAIIGGLVNRLISKRRKEDEKVVLKFPTDSGAGA